MQALFTFTEYTFIVERNTYILQIHDGMPHIISHVVKECQHGGSDEFGTVFDEGLRVDTLHEDLKTPHCDTHVGAERSQSGEGRNRC